MARENDLINVGGEKRASPDPFSRGPSRSSAAPTPRRNPSLLWIAGAIGLILVLLLWRSLGSGGSADVIENAPVPEAARPAPARPAAPINNTVRLRTGIVVESSESKLNYELARFLGSPDSAPRTFTFDKLSFDTGSSLVREADRPTLQVLAQILTVYPAAKVRVVGYADAAGDGTTQLGAERARAVVAALAGLAVDIGQLSSASGSETEPAAASATAGGRLQKPRTELIITAK